MTYGASVAGMTSPLAKYFVKQNMQVLTLARAAAVASVRYGAFGGVGNQRERIAQPFVHQVGKVAAEFPRFVPGVSLRVVPSR
jgi:hypothetical protein